MGALHAHHPGIRPERVSQLSSPHVESIDTAGAALQQTVGEAAGGGADVEAGATGRVDAEGVERAGELLAAPGHETRASARGRSRPRRRRDRPGAGHAAPRRRRRPVPVPRAAGPGPGCEKLPGLAPPGAGRGGAGSPSCSGRSGLDGRLPETWGGRCPRARRAVLCWPGAGCPGRRWPPRPGPRCRLRRAAARDAGRPPSRGRRIGRSGCRCAGRGARGQKRRQRVPRPGPRGPPSRSRRAGRSPRGSPRDSCPPPSRGSGRGRAVARSARR